MSPDTEDQGQLLVVTRCASFYTTSFSRPAFAGPAHADKEWHHSRGRCAALFVREVEDPIASAAAEGHRIGMRLSGPVHEGVARTLVDRGMRLFAVDAAEIGAARLALARAALHAESRQSAPMTPAGSARTAAS